MAREDIANKFHLEFVSSIDAPGATHLAFNHAIKVYINKPQVVNKWLAGSITPDISASIEEAISSHALTSSELVVREFVPKNTKILSGLKYLIVFFANNNNNYDKNNDNNNNDNSSHVLFKPLLEAESSDQRYATVSVSHLFEFSDGQISLYIDRKEIEDTKDVAVKEKHTHQVNWLKDTLLPKLGKWCASIKTDAEVSCARLATLTLYPNMVSDYSRLYQELKQIYWARFVDKWREETGTEPEKYIHEDISIGIFFFVAQIFFSAQNFFF